MPISAPNNFPIKENTMINPCHIPEKKPALLDSYPSGAQEEKKVIMINNSRRAVVFLVFLFYCLVVNDLTRNSTPHIMSIGIQTDLSLRYTGINRLKMIAIPPNAKTRSSGRFHILL